MCWMLLTLLCLSFLLLALLWTQLDENCLSFFEKGNHITIRAIPCADHKTLVSIYLTSSFSLFWNFVRLQNLFTYSLIALLVQVVRQTMKEHLDFKHSTVYRYEVFRIIVFTESSTFVKLYRRCGYLYYGKYLSDTFYRWSYKQVYQLSFHASSTSLCVLSCIIFLSNKLKRKRQSDNRGNEPCYTFTTVTFVYK